MSEEIKEYTLKFHNIYERLAPNYGYETRKDTKEFDFNSNNGKLMYATVSEIISPLLQKTEQLEKENKILKENAEHNDKVVDKVNWENMLLKGKLKDLKERIILKQLRLVNEETYNILHSDLNELLEVLDREIKYEQ